MKAPISRPPCPGFSTSFPRGRLPEPRQQGEEVALAPRWDVRFPSSPRGGDAPVDLCWVGTWQPHQDRDGELDSGEVSAGAAGRRSWGWWGWPERWVARSACQCPLLGAAGWLCCAQPCASLCQRRGVFLQPNGGENMKFPSLTMQHLSSALHASS